jgi:hypothetical protein
MVRFNANEVSSNESDLSQLSKYNSKEDLYVSVSVTTFKQIVFLTNTFIAFHKELWHTKCTAMKKYFIDLNFF